MSANDADAVAGVAAPPVVTKARQLRCPSCGYAGQLATTEELSGYAPAQFVLEADGSREHDHEGETVVHWDTAASSGIECRGCGWSHEPFSEAMLQLVTMEEWSAANGRNGGPEQDASPL